MKEEALKQMVNITIEDIQEVVKKLFPERYNKMIIDGSSQIVVSNYFYVKYSGLSSQRKVKKMIFPLYPETASVFKDFEGGETVHGRKKIMESDRIIRILEQYKVEIQEADIIAQMTDVFDFPLEIENGIINKMQNHYFIPSFTLSFDCPVCKGTKYIDCDLPDCMGKHEWDCPECRGARKIDCKDCNASSYVPCKSCKGRGEEKCTSCMGTAQVKCSHCAGDGYVGKRKEDDSNKCLICEGKGWHACSECSGGLVKCEICLGKGEVKCSVCKATGKVECVKCKATGKIVCEKCYSDAQRIGKIDCPNCKAMGRMGQLMYCETTIENHELEKIFCKNAKLSLLTDDDLFLHASKNGKTEAVLVNVNDQHLEAYDEFSGDFSKAITKELGLHNTKYPKILKEEVFYQIIPCVRASYKHVITNTIHEFTIVNFFKDPEIIFHTEPEDINAGIGSALKSTGNFFGRVFKTKSYKVKEDKKKEIRLMIYVAKADGVVHDVEKEIISAKIGDLEEFTNSEKRELFELINISTVPEIIAEDVMFSEYADKDQILKDIIQVALADGKMDAAETKMIDRIKQFMYT